MTEISQKDVLETLDLINIGITSTNNQERKQATEKLNLLAKNLSQHIQVVLASLKEEALIKNDNLKNTVILYIKNLLQSNTDIKNFTETFLSEILFDLIKLMLIDYSNDSFLINSSSVILTIINSFDNNQNFIFSFLNFLEEGLKKVDTENKLKPFLNIYLNIFKCKLINSERSIEIFQILLNSLESIFSLVISKFKEINFESQLKQFLFLNDLCTLIYECLITAVNRAKKLELISTILNTFIAKFLDFTVILVNSTIPNSPNDIILWSGNADIDTKLNLMKSKAFGFLHDLIKVFKNKIENDHLIKATSSVVDHCINGLEYTLTNKYAYFSKMNKNSPEIPDYGYEKVIFSILKFLNVFLTKEPIIGYFSSFIKNFVVNILFPLIATTENEFYEIKNEGSNYSDFMIDLIDDRKSKKIKTISCQILDKICTRYDGIGNFVVTYSIQMINYCFKGDNPNNLNQFPILNQKYSEKFLAMPTDIKLETSFLIFVVLTHIATKIERHLKDIKLIFVNYTDLIMNISSPVFRLRLCNFLGFYIDEIFERDGDQKYIEISIDYLFKNLFSYRESQGLAYQAADAINDILNVNDFKDFNKTVILRYIDNIVSNLTEIDIPLYFEITYEIVSMENAENAQIDPLKIVENCRNRILKEYKSPTKNDFNEEDSNIYINKCFNIIILITENQHYLKKHFLQFETILEPIFEYMKNPSKICFEEDIFVIILNFLKFSKSLTTSSQKLIYNLEKYNDKNGCNSEDFFNILCAYIQYCSDVIVLPESNFLKLILQIFKKSIENSYIDDPFFYSMSLIQCLFQTCNNLPENFIVSIIDDCLNIIINRLEYFNKNSAQLGNLKEVMKFVNISTILFSSFINYSSISLQVIFNKEKFHTVLEAVKLIGSIYYFPTHHAKVTIIGLSSIVSSNTISQFTLEIFNNILFLLLRQKTEESKLLKQSLKKEIDCNFVEDEDNEDGIDGDENDFDDQDDDSGFKNISKISSNSSPLKDWDEYKLFKNLIDSLRQGNLPVFNSWAASLKPDEKNLLELVLNLKRISVTSENFSQTIPRKIVSIKRNKTSQ